MKKIVSLISISFLAAMCLHQLSAITYKRSQLTHTMNKVARGAFNPHNPDIFACLFVGKDITVWNMRTKKCLHVLKGHQDFITDFAWHPTQKNLLASSDLHGEIRIWNLKTYRCKKILQPLDNHIISIGWVRDERGYTLISSSFDNTIRKWNITRGTSEVFVKRIKPGNIAINKKRDKFILSPAFNKTGKTVYSALTGKKIKKIKMPNVSAFLWHPHRNDTLAALCFNFDIIIADTSKKTKTDAYLLEGHISHVSKLSFHPKDSKILASADDSGIVKIWNIDTEECRATLEPYPGEKCLISLLAWQPNGYTLMVGSMQKNTIEIFDLCPVEMNPEAPTSITL